jgi:hypothetical protein
VHLEDHASGLALELAGAYPRSDIRRWRREAELDRRDGRVRVTDDWELESTVDSNPTRLHLLLAGTVRIGDAEAVVTALDGAGRVRLSWRPGAPCTTTVRRLDDPMLGCVWGERLTRLEIDITGLGPSGTIVWTLEETQ